ncbi:MAG: hypothetical protein ABH812_03505 [bacterium]
MKSIFKFFVSIIFITLIMLNLWVFTKGMFLSQEISKYEINTQKLKKENMELETKLYKINSLKNTSSIAASLDFSKKADPYFLDNLKVALKK